MVRESLDTKGLLVLLGMYQLLVTMSAYIDITSILPRATQILSVAFEFAEYSLQHQLANFAEVRSIIVTLH